MSEGAWHTVRRGDCVDSIAYAHGHFWETLWNAAENRDLRETRQNPNILLEDDRVWVPDIRVTSVAAASENRHRFRRKGVPAKLRLRFLFGGRPRANIPFQAAVDDVHTDGTTDQNGIAEIAIMPDAQTALLTLRPDGLPPQQFRFNLGHIDPIDTASGVQKRLRNLGIPCEKTGRLDDQTAAAIKTFQNRAGLTASGELDDATRDRLAKEHMS